MDTCLEVSRNVPQKIIRLDRDDLMKFMPFSLEQYQRWITHSERALKSAVNDLEAGFYEWACFKAQQSSEYAVKALLRGLGISAVGHSVLKLLTERLDLKASDEVVEAARELDRHYIPPRYPNAYSEGSPYEYYSKATAQRSIELAEKLISFVKEAAKKWSE